MQEPGQRRLSQVAAMCIASGPWVQGAAWARREERALLTAVPNTPGGAGAVGGSCSGSWRLPRTLGPVQDQAGGSHRTALC